MQQCTAIRWIPHTVQRWEQNCEKSDYIILLILRPGKIIGIVFLWPFLFNFGTICNEAIYWIEWICFEILFHSLLPHMRNQFVSCSHDGMKGFEFRSNSSHQIKMRSLYTTSWKLPKYVNPPPSRLGHRSLGNFVTKRIFSFSGVWVSWHFNPFRWYKKF